jgi:hypothetical protein
MTGRFDRDFALGASIARDGMSLGVERFFTDVEAPRAGREGPACQGFAPLGFRPIYVRRHFAPKF